VPTRDCNLVLRSAVPAAADTIAAAQMLVSVVPCRTHAAQQKPASMDAAAMPSKHRVQNYPDILRVKSS
jgi:hypothetical protein